ncbi:MAG: uridine kinase [Bdellovibrionales bacterium]
MTGSTKPNKPFLLGVSGGSGSGKTYFARDLVRQLGADRCAIVYQDSFYIDQSKRFDFDGGSVNFDHPSSIDFKCLAERLQNLKSGRRTEIPIYDFATHSRGAKTETMEPHPVIIVDGILIFHSEPVRALFDEMIYFDTPEDLRFQRRLERDVNERGRTPEGVRKQFFSQVKPMHDEFVEPSRVHAGLVVASEEDYQTALKNYVRCLK